MGTQGTPIWIGGNWESLSLDSSINLARLDYAVPEQVKKFLQYFQDMIKVIVKMPSTQSKCNRVWCKRKPQFMLTTFRKATCMRWTTCTRPHSPSWPISTSRWESQSKKLKELRVSEIAKVTIFWPGKIAFRRPHGPRLKMWLPMLMMIPSSSTCTGANHWSSEVYIQGVFLLIRPTNE